MSKEKFKTQWGLYQINTARTRGFSTFFDSKIEAELTKKWMRPEWTTYIIEQTYELED